MDHQSGTQNANFIQNHGCREESEAYVCCPKAGKGEMAQKKRKIGRNNLGFAKFIAYSVSFFPLLSFPEYE